ncbi:hypothetical protein, partial [Kitasatospora sp. NPDC058190]|uniref:hypothetical protein n=1 Tax=Kitasatospora sp. NPDC058190 TaxID=3346371 RepID=UPI0036DB8C09
MADHAARPANDPGEPVVYDSRSSQGGLVENRSHLATIAASSHTGTCPSGERLIAKPPPATVRPLSGHGPKRGATRPNPIEVQVSMPTLKLRMRTSAAILAG